MTFGLDNNEFDFYEATKSKPKHKKRGKRKKR